MRWRLRSRHRRRGKKYEPDFLNPHPDCLAEITIEFPYLQERYEFFRLGMSSVPGGGDDKCSTARACNSICCAKRKASTLRSTGEKLAHWQRRMIARFTRNLAHISGDLMASVYDLAVAARSVVDDNYGWEVWQMANRYLAQHETSDLETVRLTPAKSGSTPSDCASAGGFPAPSSA